MKMIKRWGVMTLVALLVLGSMGAALAEETVEPDEPVVAPDPGSETHEVTWLNNLVSFVFYWGFGDEEPLPECTPAESEASGGMFFKPVVPEEETPCFPLMVEGPNGQVNHGTMVSAFVHALKDGSIDLEGYEGVPKGQLVKEMAHLDFGKGFDDDEGDGDEVELAEEDGHGPPDHVIAKKAEKAKGKKK